MIEMELDNEKKKLFRIVRNKLGAPVRKIQLTDEQLCDLLEISVGNYAERVQNFIIENNWASLYGKDMSNTDIAYALSVRTLDITKDYSQYFSKEVGLQQRGKWELKKDFITLTNSMADMDFTSVLDKVNCPVLVLCGEKDNVNKKAAIKLAGKLPNAKFSTIENSRHEVNIDNPQDLAKAMEML